MCNGVILFKDMNQIKYYSKTCLWFWFNLFNSHQGQKDQQWMNVWMSRYSPADGAVPCRVRQVRFGLPNW